ncbi:MAG: tetratricopeptide repeat protein [Alphaproteobacteria bacterium]
MRFRFAFLILVASLWIQPTFSFETGSASAEDGRTPCCKSENPDSAQHLRTAEWLYAQFKPKEASVELLKILERDPSDFEATTKLSRAYLDIGDMIPESASDWREKRMKEYRKAEEYARRAISLNPNSTWGHFYVAASLGSMALVSSISRQIDLAGEIRSAVEKAIALDPQNGFAYHVYGIWHRKMAEIGKASRLFASVVFGRAPPSGNLETSIEYLKKAVALNPTVIASRLELAKSYMAVENWSLARSSLVAIRRLPIQFSDDAKHKQRAEQLLEDIRER